jgi:streptogramin lyase
VITAACCLLLVAAVPSAAKAPPPPVQELVVRTGRGPCGITASGGSIWIGVYGAGKLLRLDSTTGARSASFPVGPYACRLAVGTNAVWVTRDVPGQLVRVPRGSGRVRRVQLGRGLFDVLLEGHSVWTTSFDTGLIAQLDAGTISLTRGYKDGPKPAGIVRCAGSIWVGHGTGATWLTQIDPRSHRVRRVNVVLDAPAWPSCIGGELWVTANDYVVEVDPERRALVGHYHLGGTLAEAAAGPDGLIWITDKERSLVHRIDATSRHVLDSFAAGPGAYGLARDGNAMWITSFAGTDVRRFVR